MTPLERLKKSLERAMKRMTRRSELAIYRHDSDYCHAVALGLSRAIRKVEEEQRIERKERAK